MLVQAVSVYISPHGTFSVVATDDGRFFKSNTKHPTSSLSIIKELEEGTAFFDTKKEADLSLLLDVALNYGNINMTYNGIMSDSVIKIKSYIEKIESPY